MSNLDTRTRTELETVRFTLHQTSDTQNDKMHQIRSTAKELALLIGELCLNSRERSVALTKLEEVVLWSNSAISRHSQ